MGSFEDLFFQLRKFFLACRTQAIGFEKIFESEKKSLSNELHCLFKIRVKYLTILELLTVLFLIILVTGLLGIPIKNAVHEQRFQTELSVLVNQLRVAQDLMLVLQADVEIKCIRQEDGSLHTFLDPKSPLPKFSERLLKKTDYTYSAIQVLELEDADHVRQAPFTLHFFAHGFSMTKGLLRMGDNSEKKPLQVIPLQGYPSLIEPMSLESYQNKEADEQEIDERLTRFVQLETK